MSCREVCYVRPPAQGVELWRGPSRLNGKPIVVVATGLIRPSKNVKTGPMVQVWIMPARVHPATSVRTGYDASVCGDCKLRPANGGELKCYVTVWREVGRIWRAWRDGSYPRASVQVLSGRRVRIGAWGDPAAVPTILWRRVARVSDGWTGYTHQWDKRPSLRPLLMASVDNEVERARADSLGWRTFRVVTRDELRASEVFCPATSEGGGRSQCIDCLLCGGAEVRGRDIAVMAHGATSRRVLEKELVV